MFFELCMYNAILTLIYGVGLVFIPDFFMGTYIYRPLCWEEFKQTDHINIIRHLVMGCGLTWIWVSFFYFSVGNITNTNFKQTFSILNIIIWCCFVCLDHIVRYRWKLYNMFSTVCNFIICNGTLLSWIVYACLESP